MLRSDAVFPKRKNCLSDYESLRILLERKICVSNEQRQTRGSSLCVANIFRGMRNPGIGFVRIEDGSMAKTNREEKSCGTRRREGTAMRGRGENLPLRQHCESAHLAESCAAAAATDPPTPTGDEKGRENERRAESRCGASRLSHAGERDGGGGEKKRGVQGEARRGLDAEISVRYSSCEDFNAARR